MKKSALLLTGFVFCMPLTAQVTGRLSGSVVDASGAVVPGATVELFLPAGKTAALSTKSTNEGLFSFTGIRPELYSMTIDAPGFAQSKVENVKIDPARETSLPAIRMELATVSQAVNVTEATQTLQATSFEVASTITASQVQNLPVPDRQISNLFLTQPGVTNAGGNTVINGMRGSLANVTLDGINIQDNYIRSNGLGFLPNKLTISQVEEMTISSSNQDASIGGGSANVTLSSPSGGNKFHGEGYYYNRNSAVSANDWFNNKNGVAKPFLNLNQIGGSIGGPILKDKLFFYTNYEAYRFRATSPTEFIVITPAARQGILTYNDAKTGVRRSFDVLKDQGLSIDPAIQPLLAALPTTVNNPTAGDTLNFGGYNFNARNNETRDNATGRVDYNLSPRNIFSGTYSWNRDILDRPDLGVFYTKAPPITNDDYAKFLSLSWRWTPSASLTNELRGGFNIAPGIFNSSLKAPAYYIDNNTTIFDNPVTSFAPQGRDTDTYALQDNAGWVHGRHKVSFGYQMQLVNTAPYDFANVVPKYQLGFGSDSPYGYSVGDIPGASATDVDTANSLLQTLAGLVQGYTQTFNVKSKASGFVSGQPYKRHYSLNTYSGYVTDTWKIRPRLSLVLGLRYDYYTPLKERDSLDLLPQVPSGSNFIGTLLSNATLDFASTFYKPDRNNFAPNAGFAFDVFGNGRTVVRGGYTVAYANDETIHTILNNAETNAGLSSSSANSDVTGKLTGALPAVPVPAFKVPRTEADNYAVNRANAIGLPDPNLRTPYVQMYTFGIQQEVKGGIVFEARYVGNHATKEFRAFDYNQVIVKENGFLDDFRRAQNNGFLAVAAGRAFLPAYNPSIAGSQPLPVFSQLTGGGLLTSTTYRGLIQRGEVGQLATAYQQAGQNGSVQFFRNPLALGTNTVANYSNSTYNSLQVDARKRMTSGIQLQANYTFSKVLTDAALDGGGEQSHFQPFLDINNAKIERARAPWDITHVFKANYYIPLPFGQGQRFSYGPLNRIIGGWGMGGILGWQSGFPFSIVSTRATLNRTSRSTQNTANTALTKEQLDKVVGFFMTGNGPYLINPSAIGPNGRGVNADGSATFTGQVFSNPAAGTLGTLQRRMFSGPSQFNWDFSLQKITKITERQSLEIRADFYNVLNHPQFFLGPSGSGTGADQNINSASFGKITGPTYSATREFSARQIQFGARYHF